MTNHTSTRPPSRRVPRGLRDFLLGLTLFAVVAMAGLAGEPGGGGIFTNPAQARFLVEEPAVGAWVSAGSVTLRPPGQQLADLASLALAFAAVFAFNLWFARHLRRVHAGDTRRRRHG
jgi:hypothetical protein